MAYFWHFASFAPACRQPEPPQKAARPASPIPPLQRHLRRRNISVRSRPAEGAEKWDGQSADTSWWNAADTEFHISAPAQLAGLAALVNDGNDFSGQTVFLDRDIDLAGQSWTPIGQVTGINNNAAVTGVPFAGSFDGQGHRIIGLKIDIGSDMGYGLFAFSKGTIRNVGVDETSVIDLSALTRDLTAVGSIVGFNYGGLVSNCYTAAVCTDEGNTLSVDPCIGGIAGMNDYNGIIEYCWNEGSITLTLLKARIGGIAGSSVYTRWGRGRTAISGTATTKRRSPPLSATIWAESPASAGQAILFTAIMSARLPAIRRLPSCRTRRALSA